MKLKKSIIIIFFMVICSQIAAMQGMFNKKNFPLLNVFGERVKLSYLHEGYREAIRDIKWNSERKNQLKKTKKHLEKNFDAENPIKNVRKEMEEKLNTSLPPVGCIPLKGSDGRYNHICTRDELQSWYNAEMKKLGNYGEDRKKYFEKLAFRQHLVKASKEITESKYFNHSMFSGF